MSLERVKTTEPALMDSIGLTPEIGRVSMESALMIYESINELMIKSPEVLKDAIKQRDSLKIIRASLQRRASEKLMKELEVDNVTGLLNDSDVNLGLATPQLLEDDSDQESSLQYELVNQI